MNQDLERLRSIKSFPSLVKYLGDELDWEFETEDVEDLTYEYNAAEFGLDTKSAAAIREIKQLRPLVDKQPWGIFYLDFAGEKISVSALRGILRGLVAKKRASANQSEMQKWQVENLLFICTSDDFSNFNFGYFRGSQTNRAVLSTFGWHHGDTHLRTLAEYNLPALRFPSNLNDAEGWLKAWRKAFDVEAVTNKFFSDYHDVFLSVEKEVKASIKADEPARLYTQRLFNRLMFLYFIQKKGWLSFNGNKNYLRTLFDVTEVNKENFFKDRLYWLFFSGMSNVAESREVHSLEILRERRGDVPYLNGGLFDMEDTWDERDKVKIPNASFRIILDLFERYNFTVEESTPLNVQVAVDPEMLGKVFEELVTGRHESGSYYTPRQIVSFMCREALKHYLASTAGAEDAARFVDDGDASGLQNPEGVLEALRRVRVCDPACGSGAYLLGMMQELVRLRGALFISQSIGDDSAYKIKRSIIENNLYGVDKDPFAVQIAALRLWLSLAIDSEKPQPLPNLDFKVREGDSLIAPAPSANEKSLFFNRRQQVRDYVDLKIRFGRADGEQKRALREQIDLLRIEIAAALKHTAPRPSDAKIEFTRRHAEELPKQIRAVNREGDKMKAAKLQKELQTVNRQLAAWDKAGAEKEIGFDWAVEFAEVFMPPVRGDRRMDDAFAFLNDYDRQGTMLEHEMAEEGGGFDIVLANPPYGIDVEARYARLLGTKDSYPAFLIRATEISKENAQCCYIVPTSWETGERFQQFRKRFFEASSFETVVNLPYDVFREAYVDTCIVRFGAKAFQIPEYTVAVLKKKSTLEDLFLPEYLQPIPFSAIEEDSLFRVLLSPVAGRILSMCKTTQAVPLSAITASKRGIEAYQFDIRELPPRREKGWMPYFDGSVRRFFVGEESLKYVQGTEGFQPFNTGERIAIRRIVSRANRIMCALLTEECIVKKDLYIFKVNPESDSTWNVRYVLGLLNSQLLSFLYLARSSAATKDDYRQLSLGGVRELPIRRAAAKEQTVIIKNATELERLYSLNTPTHENKERLSLTEKELDDAVFDIYEVSNEDREHIQHWLTQDG